jgi:cobalt-zinc-cadmium efflux system membrane fusion protein
MKNIFFSMAILSMFTACTHKTEETTSNQPFCLSDTMQHKIVVSGVKMETVKNEITLSGKISANEDKWVKVFPVVDGVVTNLNVQLGDYVQKGQTLAVIRSSNIADYQNQVTSAKSNVSTAEKNLESTEEMFKSGLTTERDVVAARNELAKAKSDERRANQVSQIYGARSNANQTITAPISGFVVEKNVSDKMQYQANGAQPFFVISNLDEVWVMANVFESDIDKIKPGYDAEIKVAAFNNKVFHGKVDRIFNILDPQSRVMKVRIVLPNKDYTLKPEMFAQISISYNDEGHVMPAIPSQAVIFDKNKSFVMVYKDKCNIETREVEIFKTNGNTTYIKSGLADGEKIISQYQLLVYDALND